MSFVVSPRFQLAEIEDQSWCPSWLREHSHSALARMWRTETTSRGSPAVQAGDILIQRLGGLAAASKFTFIDSCAGAGGPTPLLEKSINNRLSAAGFSPVRFILTDLWPDLRAWKSIMSRSKNISAIQHPVDATQAPRLAPEGTKECRIFNLCFHHFTDEQARKVLRNSIESTDAFMIFEMTHRTPTALANTTIVILSCLIFSLVDFWWSPMHLIFTYLIPVVPVFYMVDGFVSCLRTRTAKETWRLLEGQKDLDLSKWNLESGSQLVLPPFGTLYWYAGVKKQNKE